MNKITQQCFVLFIIVNLVLSPLFAAGLQVDLNKNRGNTYVSKAKNGIDIVNIAKLNQKDISHNYFQEYNVEKSGLILNNAKEDVQTHLAGTISGNKNLQEKAATLIINEITSAHKSNLEGYTEVAGQAADVVVANPNGLMIKGAGFINAPHVSLTTGKPIIKNNELQSLNVKQGQITVIPSSSTNTLGLVTNGKLSLISNKISAQGEIVSDQLDIVAGNGLVNYNDHTVKAAKKSNIVAIDTNKLGGMYANKIRLLVSSKGAGVNLGANIISGSQGFTIAANGKVVLTNAATSGDTVISSTSTEIKKTLQSGGKIDIESQTIKANTIIGEKSVKLHALKGDATLKNIYGESSLNIDSSKKVTIENAVSKGDISIKSGSATEIKEKLQSNKNIIVTSSELKANNIIGQKNVKLYAKDGDVVINNAYGKNELTIGAKTKLQVNTTLSSSGRLNGIASTIVNHGNIVTLQEKGANANTDIILKAKSLKNNGTIAGKGSTVIDTTSLLSNKGIISALESDVLLSSKSINNEGTVSAKNKVTLSASNVLLNNKARVNGLDVSEIGKTVINNQTEIVSLNDVGVIAESIVNNQSAIKSKNNIVLTSDKVLNTKSILESDNIAVSAKDISNSGSMLLGNKQLSLAATNRIENKESMLMGDNIAALANTIINEKVQINAANNFAEVANKIVHDESTLYANNNFNSTTKSLSSRKSTFEAKNINIKNDAMYQVLSKVSANDKLNISGIVIKNNRSSLMGKEIEINSKTIDNEQGVVAAVNNITFKGTDLINMQGLIKSDGHINIDADNHINNTREGRIQSENNLKITTKNLFNQAKGVIASGENVVISAGERLYNFNGGKIVANENMALTGKWIDSYSGGIITAGNNLSIKGSNRVRSQNKGLIAANGYVSIDAGDHINNTAEGIIQAGKGLRISTKVVHNQNKGTIVSGEDILIEATKGVNNHESGKIIAKENLAIKGMRIKYNPKKELVISNTKEGLIQAGESINIDIKHLNNSNKGNIQAGSNLNIATDTLHNHVQGVIASGKNLSIQATTRVENIDGGKILAKENLTIYDSDNKSRSLYNPRSSLKVNNATSGQIQAGNNLKIVTNELYNYTKGLIAAGDDITIFTGKNGHINNTREGEIQAGKNLTITTKEIYNHINGIISSGKNVVISARERLYNYNGGKIIANENMALTGQWIDSYSGGIITAGNNLSIKGGNRVRSFNKGLIAANGYVSIDAGDHVNNTSEGIIQAGKSLNISSRGVYNHRKGTMASGKDLLITAVGLSTSEGGRIIAGEKMDLRSASLNGVSSELTALDSINIVGSSLNLSNSKVKTNTSLTIRGKNIATSGASLIANTINIDTNGLDNHKGTYTSNSFTNIKANNIVNMGNIYSNNDISIETRNGNLHTEIGDKIHADNNLNLKVKGKLLNSEKAEFKAGSVLQAQANFLENKGLLQSGTDMLLATSNITNKGRVVSGNNLALYVPNTIYNSGLLLAKNNLVVAANGYNHNMKLLHNVNGVIRADRGSIFIDSNALINKESTIRAAGDIVVSSGTVSNQYATMSAMNNIIVGTPYGNGHKVTSIANIGGSIFAGNNLLLGAQNDIASSHGGTFYGNSVSLASDNGNINISSDVLNVKNDLTLKTSYFNNYDLLKNAKRDLSLIITKGDLLNRKGEAIIANRNLHIDVNKGSVTNEAKASLSARGDVYIKGSTVSNKGRIEAGNDLKMYTSLSVNNYGTSASIHANNNLIIAGENPLLSTGSINNTDASISSSKGFIKLSTKQLQNISTKTAKGGAFYYKDLAAAKAGLLEKNYDSSGARVGSASISAGGNLYIEETNYGRTYKTQAIFNNHARLQAKGNLFLNMKGNIYNYASSISGNNISMISRNKGVYNYGNQQFIRINTKGYVGSTSAIASEATIHAKGNLYIKAAKDIFFKDARVDVTGRAALIAKKGDILFEATEAKGHIGGENDFAETIRYKTSSLNANDSIVFDAKNIILDAASIASRRDTLLLNATGSITTNALNNSDYSYYYDKDVDKKWYGKKYTIVRNYDLLENVLSTNLKGASLTMIANGNINLDATKSYGNAGSIFVKSKNNVAIKPHYFINDRENYKKVTRKFHGNLFNLSSNMDRSKLKQELYEPSELISKNEITVIGKNINMVNAKLKAANNVNLYATDNLNISYIMEREYREEQHSKSGIGMGGNLYASIDNLKGSVKEHVKGSSIEANGVVRIDAGSANIIGSNIFGAEGIGMRTSTGDINILSAVENHSNYSNREEITVGFTDTLKAIVNPLSAISLEDGRASVTLASANYHKLDTDLKTQEVVASTLNTLGGNVIIDSAKDINIVGSSINTALKDADDMLAAKGNIILNATNNVNITDTNAETIDYTKEVNANAEIGLTLQHQAIEVAKSARDLNAAKDQVVSAKKAFDTYRDNLKNYATQLESLKKDYKAKKPGVTLADIEELENYIDDAKGDQKFYITNIAAATANLTSKTTLLAQQTSAAAKSPEALGFNVGIQLDIDGTKNDTQVVASNAVGSSLSGKNITIIAGDGATIQGSELLATDTLGISAATLDLLASQSTQKTTTDASSSHVTASVTLFGAAGGPTVNASLNNSSETQTQTTHINTTLNGNKVIITTANNMNVDGANIHGIESASVDVGGDLTFASVQNISTSKMHSSGVSTGSSFNGNGDVSGVSGGVNIANAKGYSKQTVVASLTSNGTLDVNVKGHTELVGATIASIDENGKDTGLMTFTSGTFDFSDLKNVSSSSNLSAGVSASAGVSPSDPNNGTQNNTLDVAHGSETLSYQNNSAYKVDKTLATIGQGIFTVGGDTYTDTTLNRDTENVNTELFDVSREQGNIDLTVDNRLFNEQGRLEIQQELKDAGKNVQTIANNVPEEQGGSAIENFIGKALNLLNSATLGITPSADSDGGIIAQVPILLGDRDINHQVIQISAEKKEGYVSITELEGYDKDKPSQYDWMFVKVADTITQNSDGTYTTHETINSDNATYQNAVNGMINSPYLAVVNGIQQTGMVTQEGYVKEGAIISIKSNTITQSYNPTHGIIGDLLESGVDKFFGEIFHTGIAKQTGDFIYDVAKARGDKGSNFPMHSQGNALVHSGLQYLGKEAFASITFINTVTGKNGTPTFASYASPIPMDVFKETTEQQKLKYLGTETHNGDFVGEVLGTNTGNDDTRSLLSRLLDPFNPVTYYNVYTLFTENSPHSTYICGADGSNPNFICGDP